MMAKKTSENWSWSTALKLFFLVFFVGGSLIEAKKSSASPSGSSSSSAPIKEEPVIEEVSAKQLERLLNDKDYVAVFWCKSLFNVFSTIKSAATECSEFGGGGPCHCWETYSGGIKYFKVSRKLKFFKINLVIIRKLYKFTCFTE